MRKLVALVFLIFLYSAGSLLAQQAPPGPQGPTGAPGGSPAGADTQVQFNAAGIFGADASFTFKTKEVKIGSGAATTPGTLASLVVDADKSAGDFSTGLYVIFADNVNGDNPVAIAAHASGTSQDGQDLGDEIAVLADATWNNNTGTGILDNLVGVDVSTTANDVGITNNIGIRVHNMSGGTNNYAIYTGIGLVHITSTLELGDGILHSLSDLNMAAADGTSGGAGSGVIINAGLGDMSGNGGTVFINAGASSGGTPGDVIITSDHGIQLLSTVTATSMKASTYKSSDGSTGVTVTTCTAFKNGLCVAGS